jgi:chromosome segregation protein
VRIDPGGAAIRLLARTVWVPHLRAALIVQPKLPAGWVVVTRDGAVVTSLGVVTMGRGESLLERRAEAERLVEEYSGLQKVSGLAAAEASDAANGASMARASFELAREAERKASAARREAEESERRATRALETIAREAAWRSSQAFRLETDRDRLRESVKQASAAADAADVATARDSAAAAPNDDRATALREWEARAASLRGRRDQLAAEEATLESTRREAEARRARAAAAANLDQDRIASLELQRADLVRREQEIEAGRESLGEELAAAGLREAAVRVELEELRAVAAVARSRLFAAEAAAGQARERLRICQERVRAAEVAELEARLVLEAIREQVLVELAGLGDLGIRLLIREASRPGPGTDTAAGGEVGDADDAPLPELPALPPALAAANLAAREARSDVASNTLGAADAARGAREAGEDDAEAADAEADSGMTLELLLSDATERWAEVPAIEPPGTSKLSTLRRRFHELGAPNPFAAEEYEQVKTRLGGLDAQRADLTAAISKTRALIEQLNAMIATQFRSTFTALEGAFDSRFRQLFGGGFARLSLTEPEDLASTGIEIVARPPGKKAQPLSMLSGGERALTAVALLFAMLQVHPVPFCVLDEVDAALDEANVGRFAQALRGLADQTQFIVITHNRGTIEAADALYGVTVSDDAVSRVVSLRLEEARDLADQVTKKSAAATAG